MWTQMSEGRCLSAAFFSAGRQSFTAASSLHQTFEYAAVSPEKTPGHLGIGTLVKLSLSEFYDPNYHFKVCGVLGLMQL